MSAKSLIRRAVPKTRSEQHVRLMAKSIKNLCQPEVRECNLCGYRGRFWPDGNPPRKAAVCGNCGLKERHRLVGLWLSTTDISGLNILHFAPEPGLKKLFKFKAGEYRAADLNPAKADIVLNIEDIDLPDESVDLVVCSHVLEHVDDAKALHELHRILVPGGRAVLMVPVVEGWDHTYEEPAHTSPEDRFLYYAQHDHVRMFGRDVRDRIRDAGFHLTEFTAEEPNVARYGLRRGEKVFIATKGR